MQRVELSNTKLNDVLLRLGVQEKNVCVLANAVIEGWDEVLCWSPDAVLRVVDGAATSTASDLKHFVRQEQAKGRLVIGYLSYDFGAELHGVALKTYNDLKMPPVFAASFSSWISFASSVATVHAANSAFAEAVTQIMQRAPRKLPANVYDTDFAPTQSRESYQSSYQKVKDYIRSGDVYQINLTHRLQAKTSHSGRDVFCSLSQKNTVGFQSYIEGDDFEVLSFSPERFVKVHGRLIETSPIKGTRPRGATEAEDTALQKDLETNDKDRAELNMITELLRNDIGAVSKVGSVEITDQRVITPYPTLWHAHSTITAELARDVDALDALISLMPGGSITGCPKKRAIEIIDELEDVRRGVYTGSIFTINPAGDLDSNIAIRTIIKKGNDLYLSVGGGIVADSNEGAEYQESLDKAASFMHPNGKLSSDILEQQFGPTKVKVLYQDAATRVICTKTVDGTRTLELSRVEFMQQGIAAYPDVHQSISDGLSMGKAFRDQSIEFIREVQSVETRDLSAAFNQFFDIDGAATLVTVNILVGPNKIPYASILEAYSSAVSWPEADHGPPIPDDEFNRFIKLLS